MFTKFTGKLVGKVIQQTLFVFLIFFLPDCLGAETLFVTDVVDGDSLKGRLENERIKTELRLWGIDSPEWNQTFGSNAKNYLRKRVLRKKLHFASYGRDRYNRLLVILYEGEKDKSMSINQELVANGYSWVYKRFCNEVQCEQWIMSQEEAKTQNKGLWRSRKPIPPWQFKRKQ